MQRLQRQKGALLAGAAVGVFACMAVALVRRERQKRQERALEEGSIKPPLPPEVVSLLKRCSLCYLSTFTNDHPHLSLMNFTYFQEDEVVIMSTRRDTKKYQLLQGSNNVALLVHDFPGQRGGGGAVDAASSAAQAEGQTFSITMNGPARIESGEQADKYREAHRKNNPTSEQFIVGENIAIVTVKIESARICNLSDKVTYWDAKSQRDLGA